MDKKRRITVLLTAAFAVLALAALYCAQSSDMEADVFYKSAQGYTDSGDWDNALMSVWRAREIYTDTKNTYGIKKCDDLIGKIESTLQPIQLADKYYNIAGTYFLQGHDNADLLQRSIGMGKRCDSLYVRIGGSAGVAGKLKCEDLIERATTRINELTNDCIRAGDEYYLKAQNSYFQGYYLSARGFAVNASERYISCPYQSGIDNSASLLSSINGKINDLRMDAKASYDKAISYYSQDTKEDYQRCIQYAASSQSFYKKIDDNEGYTAATTLASRCSERIGQLDDDRLRVAESYMAEAKRLISMSECMNSTDDANRAMSIYQLFYNQATLEEKMLPREQQVKMNLYSTKMQEVNSVLFLIRDTCTADKMLKIAEDFYAKSQGYYLQNDLNEALTYAGNARNIFFKYQKYVGVSKCDTLISQINLRINQRTEAEGYMQQSQAHYNVADFDIALLNANKARSIYDLVFDKEKVKDIDDFMVKIREGANTFEIANSNFREAKNYFEINNYDSALAPAQKASELYIQINYSVGMAESANIVKISQEKVDEARTRFYTNAAMFGIVITVSAFMVIQFTRRKKAVESEYRKKIRSEDERARRQDEAWSIKAEEETKKGVEDELRKLIEAERGKLDES
jgi:hypothetical protein